MGKGTKATCMLAAYNVAKQVEEQQTGKEVDGPTQI